MWGLQMTIDELRVKVKELEIDRDHFKHLLEIANQRISQLEDQLQDVQEELEWNYAQDDR